MATIQEGISKHNFYTTIWFNVDEQTGEIKSIEFDNGNHFNVRIDISLDGEHYKTVKSKRKNGLIEIPPGYYLEQIETGFDMPDPEKFAYKFTVMRY